MAINLRCVCGSEAKLTAKACPKCGTAFPKKGRRYKVTLRVDGRKVTRTVSNLKLAQDIEGTLKVDIARGEHDLRKRKAPTLAEVWAKYLPWAETNKKSADCDRWNFEKHLRPTFGQKHLNQISPFDIERLIVSMKGQGYAPATIRHQTILLSRIYVLAERWGLYAGPNPCKKVRPIKVNNQVTERLTDEQLTRLLAVLDEWPCRTTAALVKFLLSTGLRKGEAFKLAWADVDLHHRLVTLRDPKGGRDVVLPLSDKAVTVLQEAPRTDSPFVFPGRDSGQRRWFHHPWSRIREAAGLPDTFRLHGLRHHFASTMVSNGVDLYTVSQLLTHKDVATTQRYAHLSDQTLRDALKVSDQCQAPQDGIVVPLRRVA